MTESMNEQTKAFFVNTWKKKKKKKKNTNTLQLCKVKYVVDKINPCPAEPGYTLPLQTV